MVVLAVASLSLPELLVASVSPSVVVSGAVVTGAVVPVLAGAVVSLVPPWVVLGSVALDPPLPVASLVLTVLDPALVELRESPELLSRWPWVA